MQRITHKHVEQACERYNAARKLKYPAIGHLQWADIRGDGSNRRGLYVTINENGGVSSSNKRRRTMRQTIAAIDLAIRFGRLPHFCVIIQAIHERGETQRAALDELAARGLWLSADQRSQAGLKV